ncbi:hypothetical protein Tco_0950067 [Tanacetum coccineum]
MKPAIENLTITEYLEYEAAKERQLWDNVRSKRSPTNYDEADFDSFHQNKRAKNLRQIGEEKIQNECDDDTSMGTNNVYDNLLNFPIFSATHEFSSVCEQDVDLEKKEPQVEDGDDGDTYDIWDITVEDVEQIRKFLTPNVPDRRYEILNVTMVNEEADFNPTKDIEKLERLLAKDPQSHFIEIQVH